jgi:hypothetical protein
MTILTWVGACAWILAGLTYVVFTRAERAPVDWLLRALVLAVSVCASTAFLVVMLTLQSLINKGV